MALYTQRRRRTRSRSAWIGGPFVNPPTEVTAENGLATFARRYSVARDHTNRSGRR